MNSDIEKENTERIHNKETTEKLDIIEQTSQLEDLVIIDNYIEGINNRNNIENVKIDKDKLNFGLDKENCNIKDINESNWESYVSTLNFVDDLIYISEILTRVKTDSDKSKVIHN